MLLLMWLGALVSTIGVVLWAYFFRKSGHRYDELLQAADPRVFTLRDLYGIGLAAIETYENASGRKMTQSDRSAKKIKELAEVFGRDNAELFFYIYRAAQISLVLTFVPVGLMTGCIMQSLLGFILGGAVAYAMIVGVQSGISTAIKNKKEAILREFPQMVSKLTLLINAGMLVRRAWDEVACSNVDGELYKEMRTTSKDLQEGASIEHAMASFADRCSIKEIRKFSSIYVQAVNRGASEAIHSMKVMSEDAWEQKKQLAKQKGEIASQKLLIPNLIMFLGILAVVVVPMVASILGAI